MAVTAPRHTRLTPADRRDRILAVARALFARPVEIGLQHDIGLGGAAVVSADRLAA